jgi:ComF family protein
MAINLWGRVNIQKAASMYSFKKGNTVQTVLHLIKYRNQKSLGHYMGIHMGIAWKDAGLPIPDIVMAVPMHPDKQKIRGYNQSELLASGLAQNLGIPHVVNNLIRLSAGESQTRKSRYERWLNVSDKYVVQNPNDIYGKHVLLVDDVFTTGATMEACIVCLKMCEPKAISVFTLASTL